MTYDDIAQCFVQPNRWLKDAVPAGTCAFDVPAVLAAARADRWAVKVLDATGKQIGSVVLHCD